MGGTFASAENGVAFEAWQGAGGVGFRELPNGFFSVYSDSGANKTGGLNFISAYEMLCLVLQYGHHLE